MANPELKPCPFCGGKADFEEVDARSTVDHASRWSVGCNDGNEDRECFGYQSLTSFSRKSEAAAAWNTRAGEKT